MEFTPAELMVFGVAVALLCALWIFYGTLAEGARAFLVLLATLAVALHRCVG